MKKTSNKIKNDICAFTFKRRLFWIGWVVIKREMSTLYADNNPYITMTPEMEVVYVTLGLSKKSVMNRIAKKLKGGN